MMLRMRFCPSSFAACFATASSRFAFDAAPKKNRTKRMKNKTHAPQSTQMPFYAIHHVVEWMKSADAVHRRSHRRKKKKQSQRYASKREKKKREKSRW